MAHILDLESCRGEQDLDCDATVAIPMEELPQDRIPTFDASDVNHYLEKTQAERLAGKWLIACVSYNPLPLVRLALVQAHTRNESVGGSENCPARTRCPAFDVAQENAGTWDLEIQNPMQDDHIEMAMQFPQRKDLLVTNLSPIIQRAFRQSVLSALVTYVCVSTAIVATCLVCIPWAYVQQLNQQSPCLLSVVEISAFVVLMLSVVLLYTLRFDSPSNLVVLVLLTLSEIVFVLVYGVRGDPHTIVQGLALFSCSLILFRAFACRSRNCKTTGEPLEMPSAAQAALQSLVVLALVSVPLNMAIGNEMTHATTTSVAVMLGVVALGLLWVSLVLSVLMQTSTAEEHGSALVSFQADLVVVSILLPVQVLRKRWRQCMRLVESYRDGGTNSEMKSSASNPPVNAVVPTFWPEGLAEVTSRGYPSGANDESPLYPAHLVPRRTTSHVHAHPRGDEIRQTSAGSNAPTQSGPRHRNSVSDD